MGSACAQARQHRPVSRWVFDLPTWSGPAMRSPIDPALDQLLIRRQAPWTATVRRIWGFGPGLVEWPIAVAQGKVQHTTLADAMPIHQRPHAHVEVASAR